MREAGGAGEKLQLVFPLCPMPKSIKVIQKVAHLDGETKTPKVVENY
jgi:hypothetical protein